MFCTKCGNTIEDGARFCTKCGQSFEPQADLTASLPVHSPKKSSGANKAIVILLSVLIVAVLAIGGTVAYLLIARPDAPTLPPVTGDQGGGMPEILTPGAEIKDYAAAREVLVDYLTKLPQAVNTGSYSYIEPYILDGSPLHSMQVSLVANNYGKGITERFIDYDVDHVEWVNEKKCYIYTEERYEITSGGSSNIREYEWKYTVIEEDGRYYLTNLEAYDD